MMSTEVKVVVSEGEGNVVEEDPEGCSAGKRGRGGEARWFAIRNRDEPAMGDDGAGEDAMTASAQLGRDARRASVLKQEQKRSKSGLSENEQAHQDSQSRVSHITCARDVLDLAISGGSRATSARRGVGIYLQRLAPFSV